jgi:hypothetical protein
MQQGFQRISEMNANLYEKKSRNHSCSCSL